MTLCPHGVPRILRCESCSPRLTFPCATCLKPLYAIRRGGKTRMEHDSQALEDECERMDEWRFAARHKGEAR